MKDVIYNHSEDRFDFGNELNVILSLMTDKELLKLEDGINFLMKEDVFQIPNFPLACGGLNHLTFNIQYELASRVGKSIKIENGEAVRCEKEESVWSNRDWREKPVVVKPVIGEEPYREVDLSSDRPTLSEKDTDIDASENVNVVDDADNVEEGGDWV